ADRKFFVTPPIAVTEDIYEARASIEVDSTVGDAASVRVLWAEANDPMVPADWTYEEAEPLLDWETSTTYGTEFVQVAPTKKYLRFVVAARLGASGLGFARVRTLVEYRD